MPSKENTFGAKWSFRKGLVRLSKEYMILIVLLVSVLAFSFSSKYFFTSTNLLNILLQCSTIAIVAIGQAYVMLSGNLDLSLGQSVCLACYTSAILMKNMNVNPWISLDRLPRLHVPRRNYQRLARRVM